MARIVTHTEAGAQFGEKLLSDVAVTRSFSSLVFELLCERAPTDAEHALFELVLNLTIDHGPDTPSAKVTIEKAQNGETMGVAVGAGIAEINGVHGGAQDALMDILALINTGIATPASIVKEYAAAGKRIPGYGHRIYTVDPRTTQIFEALLHHNMGASYRESAETIQKEIEAQLGKKLPINIDGAIAVVLSSFGWPPTYGTAVFIIARTAGLCGHYINKRKLV